jgi:hypothetical protein
MGGALGVVLPGQLPWVLEKAVFALSPGAMSGIVETPFGFAILQRWAGSSDRDRDKSPEIAAIRAVLPGAYRSFVAPPSGAAGCRRACAQDDRCRAYTFARAGTWGPKARCILRSDAGVPARGPCCISEVK